MLNPGIINLRRRLMVDFPFYAQHCLKIRTKEGNVLPFTLNYGQRYLHKRMEEQLANKKQIRILILKGRQMGLSTYVQGRFFWRVTHRFGVRAFILTHDQEATNNLFEMTSRMYQYCPDDLRPSVDRQNAKELYFNDLDSGYKVGTAGNRSVGRSSTVQYFHGSEVAYWPHADEHAKGILQAIPRGNLTEVILETTANGVGNYFYEQWMRAEHDPNYEYLPVFIPWFWQPEYKLELEETLVRTDEEKELVTFYKLTDEQLNWRRYKVGELSSSGKDGALAFKQEYPCTPMEAFSVSTIDTIIKIESVLRAQTNKDVQGSGAKVLGVDIARFGDDFTAFARRHGRRAYNIEKFNNLDGIQVAHLIYERHQKEQFDYICLDVIGVGASVHDQLKLLLPNDYFYSRVIAVNAAETRSMYMPSRYVNKRAEMWGQMAEWFTGDVAVSVPDDQDLLSQLCAQRYDYKAYGKIIMLDKREDGLPSPDKGDALAMTFALPEGKLQTDFNIVKELIAFNSNLF